MSGEPRNPRRRNEFAEDPDPSLLVERDPRESSSTTRGWYLDPASNGTRERFYKGTGFGWDHKTRGSGPLRRWFRGLSDEQQRRVYAMLLVAGIIALAYLTRDAEFVECQYGGGRFDYTC